MYLKDILVAARPDQSLQIYKALLKSRLSFHYITFKVVPSWVKKIVTYNTLVPVYENASFVIWGTFKHLAIRKYHWGFTRNWSDRHILDGKVKRKLNNTQFKIIHIWPENCGISKNVYKKSRAGFVIADIHMAHPAVVYDEMKPIYAKYGIDAQSTSLYKKIEDQKGYVDEVDNILVPTSYVAETYKTLFPNKNYYVVPYGISFRIDYVKTKRAEIKEFVYVGAISLEKGCDLLLDYYSAHPNLNIHLFGSVLAEQSFIFDKYRKYSNIIFHGRVPKSQLKYYIKQYDVGIYLSRFDAYSLAVGELIGSRLPVIVSDKTGQADDVIKFGFGIVSKLDTESINSAIETIQCKTKYYAFQDNIEEYIRKGSKDYGQMMIEFYNDVLEDNATKYLVI